MLDELYEQFIGMLQKQSDIHSCTWRFFAGQRFLYVDSPLPAGTLARMLLEAGLTVTATTKLKVECIYVRSVERTHVLRFRFQVPNEKQFCCGNLCEDCFLLRNR